MEKQNLCRICDFIHPNLSNLLLNHHQIIKTTTNTPAINCFEQQLQLFSGTSTFWAILIEILSSIMSSSHPNKQIFPHWIQQLLPFLDKPDTFKKNLHELIENIPLSFSYILCFISMGEVLNVVNRFLKFGFDKTISMAPIVSLFVRWFRIYLLYPQEISGKAAETMQHSS